MGLRWEHAGSGGSGFTGWGESGFVGTKLVVVDLSLVGAVDLAALGASW